MLVIELEISIRIGSPDVGNPAAIGLGVMIGVRPPCGTTAKTFGSELCTIATSPRSVARNRYTARHAMWCERRMTTVPVPCVAAIVAAASRARSVSHGPGRRPPSHVCAAGRVFTIDGSPAFAIDPLSISSR